MRCHRIISLIGFIVLCVLSILFFFFGYPDSALVFLILSIIQLVGFCCSYKYSKPLLLLISFGSYLADFFTPDEVAIHCRYPSIHCLPRRVLVWYLCRLVSQRSLWDFGSFHVCSTSCTLFFAFFSLGSPVYLLQTYPVCSCSHSAISLFPSPLLISRAQSYPIYGKREPWYH